MAIMEIIVLLFAFANAIWAFVNWRTHYAAQVRKREADKLFSCATKAFHAAQVAQEYRVCAARTHIVTNYVVDEKGETVCVHCAVDAARKAN